MNHYYLSASRWNWQNRIMTPLNCVTGANPSEWKLIDQG